MLKILNAKLVLRDYDVGFYVYSHRSESTSQMLCKSKFYNRSSLQDWRNSSFDRTTIHVNTLLKRLSEGSFNETRFTSSWRRGTFASERNALKR